MFDNNQTPSLPPDRLVLRPEVGPAGDVLVAIFLRGGMDGVYTVPPYADPAFHSQRKDLGAAAPRPNGLIDLDGFFALHPDFAPLAPLYREKLLAVVHAAGLHEPLLSHFDATRAIERGSADEGENSGWIGRHLNLQPTRNPSPLRAVALGQSVPRVLSGADARLLDSWTDFRLELPAGWNPGFIESLRKLYARGTDLVSSAGRGTLETLATFERLAKSLPRSQPIGDYPTDGFGRHLRQVAQLVKAEVGLEAAVLGIDGWDTHISQAKELVNPMRSLAENLQGFVADLEDHIRRVVVVVISEFGRRIVPNDGGGTDHGRATAMLVLGGGIRGGKVYGTWPGLASQELDEQGNLRVTTDYRHVLAEILERRLKCTALRQVFPDFQPDYLQLTA